MQDGHEGDCIVKTDEPPEGENGGESETDGQIPGNEQPGEGGADEPGGTDKTAGTDELDAQIPQALDETVSEADAFKTAIAAGGNVTLEGDITLSDNTAISVTKDTVLDLNGHTITIPDTRNKYLFNVTAGNLTIQDSSENAGGKIAVSTLSENLIYINNANSSFVMTSGSIEADNISGNTKALVYINKGHFDMSGGALKAKLSHANARTVIMSSAATTGTFTMTGGSIQADNIANVTQVTAVFINACQSASLTGGEIVSNNSGTGAVYNLWLTGANTKGVVIDGVTVKGVGTGTGGTTAIYMNGSPVLSEIKGNTVVEATGTTGTTIALNCYTGTVGSITGGEFSAKSNGNTLRAATFTGNANKGDNQSITGGTFRAESTKSGATDVAGIYVNGETGYLGELGGSVTVTAVEPKGTAARAVYNVKGQIRKLTGGTYTAPKFDNTGTIGYPAGQALTMGENKTWTLTDAPVDESTAIAKIGDTYYKTLNDALGYVEADQTIVLLQNVNNAGSVLNISNGITFTLDLNGHTITSTVNTLYLTGDGTKLILVDNGSEKGGIISTGSNGILIAEGASLEATAISAKGTNSGVYSGTNANNIDLVNCTVTGTTNYGIYLYYTMRANSHVAIDGGTYTGVAAGIYNHAAPYNNTSTITIKNAEAIGSTYGIYNNSHTINSIENVTARGEVSGLGNNSTKPMQIKGNTVMYGDKAITGTTTSITYETGINGFVKDADYQETPPKWVLTDGEVTAAENVAQVEGGNAYATFGEAFAAIKNTGGKITMLDDSTEAAGAAWEIPAGKSVEVDLNGHTLKVATTTQVFTNKGQLKITDSTAADGQRGAGTLYNLNTNNSQTYIVNSTSTSQEAVVIENVTLSKTGQSFGVLLNGSGSTGSIKNSKITCGFYAAETDNGTFTAIENSELEVRNHSAVYLKTANSKVESITGSTLTAATGNAVNMANGTLDSITDSTITATGGSAVIMTNGNLNAITDSTLAADSGSAVNMTNGTLGSITGSNLTVNSGSTNAIALAGAAKIGSITGGFIDASKGTGRAINLAGTSSIGSISGTEDNPISITSNNNYAIYLAANTQIGTINYADVTGSYGLYSASAKDMNLSNSTFTGTTNNGILLAGKITSITDCAITGGTANSAGLQLNNNASRIDALENCKITGGNYGLYMSNAASIGEIKGESTRITATNAAKNSNGFAINLANTAKIETISGGTYTGTNTLATGKGTGYAIYVAAVGAEIGSFAGKTEVIVDLPDGVDFIGQNYGIYNIGKLTVSDGADITGDNLYYGIRNYNTGQLTVNGGTIGGNSCLYGIFNDQNTAAAVPELTITGGTITGGTAGVYNEGKTTEISGDGTIAGGKYGLWNVAPTAALAGTVETVSGGTFTGSENGIFNEGILTTLSGGTTTTASKYGVSNQGTIGTLSGGNFGGEKAGVFVGTGTVNAISGNISINSNTPYGVVYSSKLSHMPENFVNNGNQVISGAANYPNDSDANYKDYGVMPTTRGKSFFANGVDIDINSRNIAGEKGCIITWKNDVLGEQSFDTGNDSWDIYGGSDGRNEALTADEIGTPVEAPMDADGAVDINVYGGTANSIYGGGLGNTYVKKVVMNIYGGTFTAVHGGGSFTSYFWGGDNWGKGWAVVDELEMNMLGRVSIGYFIGMGGNGNAWVEKATANMESDYVGGFGTSGRFHVNGDVNKAQNTPMDKAHEALGIEVPNTNATFEDMTVADMAERIKAGCLTKDGKRNEGGVGTVVNTAVVNYNKIKDETSYVNTLCGGNIGGYPVSYTGDLTVNVAAGAYLRYFELGGHRGHVEDTTVNVSDGGTLYQIQNIYLGSTGDLDVNVEDGGEISAINLGKVYEDTPDGKGHQGGIVPGSIINVNNDNSEWQTTVTLAGGVVTDKITCTGNVLMRGNVSSGDKYNALYGFIREGSVYKANDFSWTQDFTGSSAYYYDFGQRGYLLVTGDVINMSQCYKTYYKDGANFVLGTATGDSDQGDGNMYVYEGKLKESDITDKLKETLEKDGNTVVLGTLVPYGGTNAVTEYTIHNGRIQGLAVDEYLIGAKPATVVVKAGGLADSYTVLATDKDGNQLAGEVAKEWSFTFAEDGTFEANPDNYVTIGKLENLEDGMTVQYMATRNGVSFFGKTQIKVVKEENIKTLTYDLNGGKADNLELSVPAAGDTIRVTDVVPTKDGAVFAGWNTKEDSSGTVYQPNSVISMDKDVTLYAQWRNMGDYTITVLDKNGDPIPNVYLTITDDGKEVVASSWYENTGAKTGTDGTWTGPVPEGVLNVLLIGGLDSASDNLEDARTWQYSQSITVDEDTKTATVTIPFYPGTVDDPAQMNTLVNGSQNLQAADNLINAVDDTTKKELQEECWDYISETGALKDIHIMVRLTEEEYQDEENGNPAEAAINNAAAGENITFTDFSALALEHYIYKWSAWDLTKVDPVREPKTILQSAVPITARFRISDGLYQSLADNDLTTADIVLYRHFTDETGADSVTALNMVSESEKDSCPEDSFWIENVGGAQYIGMKVTKITGVYGFGVHVHEYGNDWKYDDDNHWHECECGEKSEVGAHISDGGKVTTPATATKDGVKTYTCTVCGKVLKTERIPATGTGGATSGNTGNTGKGGNTESGVIASKTGDTNNLWLYVLLLIFSGGCIVAAVGVRRRKNKR